MEGQQVINYKPLIDQVRTMTSSSSSSSNFQQQLSAAAAAAAPSLTLAITWCCLHANTFCTD